MSVLLKNAAIGTSLIATIRPVTYSRNYDSTHSNYYPVATIGKSGDKNMGFKVVHNDGSNVYLMADDVVAHGNEVEYIGGHTNMDFCPAYVYPIGADTYADYIASTYSSFYFYAYAPTYAGVTGGWDYFSTKYYTATEVAAHRATGTVYNLISYTGDITRLSPEMYVNADGDITDSGTDNIRLCIRLAAELGAYIDDSGFLRFGTAPSAPASIAVTGYVNGDTDYFTTGSTAGITWSRSTDQDGHSINYVLEVSGDGSTWKQIYSGTSRSTTLAITSSYSTVAFRVKAVDETEMESGYVTSSTYTVQPNTAPTTPASITVPSTIITGTNFTVSWGASTDADGNLSGYQLQRSVDGATYETVYTGASTAYVDNLASAYNVSYRVRAFDSYSAYSGYITSNTYTVSSNYAPVITCSTADGGSLGTLTAATDITYTVSDQDGDTVTVSEYLDGTQLRSYTATLDAENTLSITTLMLLKCLNGTHTIKIVANDGTAETNYVLYFVKDVDTATITLTNMIETTSLVAAVSINTVGSIPSDATVSLLVSNNASDASPVWENATSYLNSGSNYVFSNSTAATYAFGYILTVTEGSSGTGGYINSVYGGYKF